VTARGLAANLALALVAGGSVLGLLEGTARLLEGRRPAPPPVADYIWDWSEKMPGGFYTMKSEAVGWPPWEEFNRDGLRDRARPHEKLEGTWRVAVLGDSVTLGAEIRPYEAFPQVMEGRQEAAGRRVEVMNVALWGWSTRQERMAWERIARAYRPDQAILAVCLNDIPELQNNLARPPRWLLRLHERSALVRRIVNARGREIDSVERLFAEPEAPRVKEAMARFFDEVRALRSEVVKDGARFAVVVFPFRFQVAAGAPPPVVQERIAAFCKAEGIDFLDLLPALRHLGESAFVDYDHLSPSGASLTADTILASGLLPDAAAPAPEPSGTVAELARRLRGDEHPARRAEAARRLGSRGESARPAVDALLTALGDPSEAVRFEAAQALVHVEPRTGDVPALVRALASTDAYVRGFAAWSLGNLQEAARDAVPALVAAINEDETSAVVAGALARIGPAAEAAVPSLAEALRSPDPGRRWRAARALGRIGPRAGTAVQDLAAALTDPNEAVRAHAARALGRIGPGARPAAAALQRATGDPDPGVRQEARGALEHLH
jgi:lysophospholipase L1-like esterase